MSSRQGESTAALFGFIRSYFKLTSQFNPKHLVAIFDGQKSKESRTKLFAAYKAHREITPPDLIAQILEAEHFCRLMGIPTLALPGVEADDTIGACVTWAHERAKKIYVCTSDKDLAQLVDEKVVLLNQFKENLIIDEAGVEAQWGVKPSQMVDYLSIVGDTSDNIPGISGFGPKTAVELLKKYGSLEKILNSAEEIGGKKTETLVREKETALLCQKLVSLDRNVPIPHEGDFYALKKPDWAAVRDFFQKKDFLSLLKTIPEEPSPETSTCHYHTIEDEKALDELIHMLSHEKEVCLDTETKGQHPITAEMVGIGFAKEADAAYYIPLNGSIPRETIIKKLKPLLEGHVAFYGHNIKFDRHILENDGIHLRNICFDTILASYLLNAHERRHNLDDLSLQYFGKKKIDILSLIGTGRKQITMDQVPIEQVAPYCCEDVEYTLKLKKVLSKELKTRGIDHLLYDIELPLIPILSGMERRGVYVDVPFLKHLSVDIAKDIAHAEEEVYTLAGERFNINSPKQLGDILFTKLGLPSGRRGKTAPSTGAEILEALAIDFPIAQKILDYRSLEKLRSTYIDTLPSEVNPKTGRIHCTFNQSVAATGRLACQDPNLQNIPVRTTLGKKIREAFRPQETGWSYVSFDYSQIELRLMAHLTEDEGLLAAFEQGVDIHAYTASTLFGIPMSEVTDEQRRSAKAVNFGVIYGQQAFGLSQGLGISMKDAAKFIEQYYIRYPRVKNYIEHAKNLARKSGKAVTLTGRERLIPEINSSNSFLRAAAERLAINTPLQGTAADIIKIAMLKCSRWLDREKLQSAMILQIHDELIFEAPDEEVEILKKGITPNMEEVFELKVPLTVQISVGKNWKEC
jgi:DNA polymerase-1